MPEDSTAESGSYGSTWTSGRSSRSPEVEQERAVAIYDLLEENSFQPLEDDGGPYHLRLAVQDGRLIFDIRDTDDVERTRVRFLPHSAGWCGITSRSARATTTRSSACSPPRSRQSISGPLGLHNEGSEMLRERLDGKIAFDFPTARRLFTLCKAHIRGSGGRS